MDLGSTAWLEDIAAYSSSTLAILHRKAEEQKTITDGDQIMSEICMGYLYLLNIAHSEGILNNLKSVGNSRFKHTIH